MKEKIFSIIHYQSGLDRATNEFRDYSGVVFLGEFHVPNEVVAKFNRDYRSNTNPQNYLTYQLVQAICRTRIRLHQGLPINVYFSNDWSDDVIKNCIKYLDRDEVSNVIDETLSYIKPKWRPVIKLFSSLDDEFKYAIENKLPYKFNFTLDEIYELIPMYEKKVKWYNPLVNYLGKLGIELNIKSEIGRNQYSKIK